MGPNASQISFYSYGLVAKDKARGDNEISVFPVEVRFSQVEAISEAVSVDKIEHNITEGKDFVTMRTGNTIPAQWIDFNTNRITPPDVKEKDLVLIWRLGDTDMFFWQDRNVANVKRLETVVYAFSADPKNGFKPDMSNAYYIMISSHDKHVTLATSKSNGEYCRYTMQLNTGDGRFVLSDDIGNSGWFDSAKTNIGWKNAKGTTFVMDKTHIFGYAKDSIKFESKYIGFNCDTYNIDTKTYNAVSKSYTIKADTYTANADTWSVNGKAATISAATIGLNGNISMGGAGSSGSSSGAMSFQGDVTFSSAVNFTGDVTMSKLHVDNFSHGGGKCC